LRDAGHGQAECGHLRTEPAKESKHGAVFDPLQAAFEIVLAVGEAAELPI
jgi:hypothetical protein